jgi:hypothetical protein
MGNTTTPWQYAGVLLCLRESGETVQYAISPTHQPLRFAAKVHHITNRLLVIGFVSLGT